jgi:hypothetical protein
VYQIFGPDNEPVSDAEWMTLEEANELLKQFGEGCYVGMGDGIEIWEGE